MKNYTDTGRYGSLSLWLYPVLFLIFFIIFSSHITAQNNISGRVLDFQTREPLAFVNILTNNSRQVSQTDIDGIFRISGSVRIDSLRLSYVGYETFTYRVAAKTKDIIIGLKKKEIQLNELVILPGENPAHRIIKRMIENRDKNNPEKMKSFAYTSYNKMTFTVNIDSVKKDTLISDTSLKKVKKILDRQHLFIMESVSERRFKYPDMSNEKLIASKVSGFKDPLFALMIGQMQSFSFYRDYIHIGDKNYLTPISKGSAGKYFFLLEDTLYQGGDTVYVISFTPRKNRNFDGIKGVLNINTNGYAIQNVIAQPADEKQGGMAVKVQQKYEFIENKQWFPVQLNSDFIFKNIQLDKMNPVGESRTYIRNIILEPELKNSDFSAIELEVDETAVNPPVNVWTPYRIDSLSEKDKLTYHVIDSIGKAANLDRTMRSLEALMSGKIPFKFVDFDIDKFVKFNDYEGFRLGAGIHTNYKFSKKILTGGYFAYGTNDKSLKYGADISFIFKGNHDISAGVNYFNDLTETGEIKFYEKSKFLSSSEIRNFLINSMEKTEKKEVFFRFTSLKYLKTNIRLSMYSKSVTGGYAFGVSNENVSLLIKDFNFTELGFGFCYSFREKYIKALHSKISAGTNYPVVWFNYIRGFDNLLNGQFNYNRYDFKIKKSFLIKDLGTTTVQLQSGYVDGNIPACNLYNGIGSYRQFTIAAPYSFTTMRMNEFLLSRYSAIFFTHDFGKLLFGSGRFVPETSVATNFCTGDLNNPGNHYNINFKTVSKGYFESGLLLNKIIGTGLYSIGAGAYYRYGYHTFPKFKDNAAYKFTISFNI